MDDLLDEVEIMKTKSGDSSGGIRIKDQILKLQDEVTVEWLIDEWDFHYPYLLYSEPNSCSKLYFIVFKTWKYYASTINIYWNMMLYVWIIFCFLFHKDIEPSGSTARCHEKLHDVEVSAIKYAMSSFMRHIE